MIGHSDLTDGGEVGQQNRQGWFHFVKQPRDLLFEAGSAMEQGAEFRIVGDDLVGGAGEAVRPGPDRIGGFGLRVHDRDGVIDQGAGMAGGALNTFRQLGYALGIAVLGTVFASTASAKPGADMRASVATNLDHVFTLAGVIGLVGAAVVLLLVRRSDHKAW